MAPSFYYGFLLHYHLFLLHAPYRMPANSDKSSIYLISLGLQGLIQLMLPLLTVDETLLQSVELTITELNLLWTIFYEGNSTVNRLAELTLLDPSTVTQVISRLKKKISL
ncbi:MarR family transcriptional regulator [Bacillus sp. DJP31]|uniref:MarR family transcriptional regulator n=1 Tax=Bacillus sp. DJP31 TaxID=3409789 RepID=UPI003BB5CFDE